MEPPELPECPVCLQPYDSVSTIPRVLPCGHSTCETCLTQLPKPFPHALRCPACTQLVNYPHPQGPSALPKNIDLLRLTSQSPIQINPTRKKPGQKVLDFVPNSWFYEFYLNWNNLVVPKDGVLVESSVDNDGFCWVLSGRVRVEIEEGLVGMHTRCLMKVNQRVSLVRVGLYVRGEDSSKFEYSYMARVMWVLYGMRDGERGELGLVLRCGLRQCHRVCKVYGLWYNTDDQWVYLVCERFSGKHLGDLENGFVRRGNEEMNLGVKGEMSTFAIIAMEICEAVSDLHSEGLVLGGLALSCFEFDKFGRVCIDLNEVLVMGRRVRTRISELISRKRNIEEDKELDVALKRDAFFSPELLFELLNKEDIEFGPGSLRFTVGYGSDVWSLACVLIWLLVGEPFTEEMQHYYSLIPSVSEEEGYDYMDFHTSWMEKIGALLENRLGSEFVSLKDFLCKCLSFDAGTRPAVVEVWKCIRKLIIQSEFDIMVGLEQVVLEESTCQCLVLGELCGLGKEANIGTERWMINGLDDKDEICAADGDHVGEAMVDRDLAEGLSGGRIKSIDLKGHLDCITALAVGGDFLFSSSFDKTVCVWSLQDFTHVHSFKGHEHKVMAVVYVDEEQPLCISGDSGAGICIWDVSIPFVQEPRKKLSEEKDWRYSGIHALAISGTGYFYTGSGDKTIKAWSLQDYTLSYTMTGHKSVVSTLAVWNGVLYSGSWDGTVRLWCLSDHSPLTVFGEDTPGNLTSVLSVAVDQHVLIVAHENGSLKTWSNDVFLKSTQAHDGAIFSVAMEGKWLFTGGWNKTVNIQELSLDESQIDALPIGTIDCDSVVTALLYWQGKLFVGQANRIIKVHYYGV